MPFDVPVGQWAGLRVRLQDTTLELFVNDRSLLKYEDRLHPLPPGGFGLRPWQRSARFRRLRVRTTELQPGRIAFAANPEIGDGQRHVAGAAAWHGGRGSALVETDRPFVGTQSQRIAFLKRRGRVRHREPGPEPLGHGFRRRQALRGLRLGPGGKTGRALSRPWKAATARRSTPRRRLAVAGNDWQRLDFTLTPGAADRAGRFALELKQPGSVVLGHAFLQPGEWGRFKGLPVRRDVAEGLIDQGITVLRYGGSMVNHAEYRWKKMIGPRDRRPPYCGTWYPLFDQRLGHLRLSGLSARRPASWHIPDFNIDETPQDMADFIEYANGPAESPWGKKRAADGHPAPYRLKYLELGNEERIDDKYAERFEAVAEAIWAEDPEIILVVGDFVYGQPITDPNR